MNKLILLVLLLSACGGSKVAPPVVVIDEPIESPVKETLLIRSNDDNKTLVTIKYAADNNYEAMILNATYSQVYRDGIADCANCFSLVRSVILGDDKYCEDCYPLMPAIEYLYRSPGIKVFIVVQDKLTIDFVGAILSTYGFDAVLVSTDEDLLLSSDYNYELALIGETDNINIKWHITDNVNCSAKCISPADAIGFDAVIVPPFHTL